MLEILFRIRWSINKVKDLIHTALSLNIKEGQLLSAGWAVVPGKHPSLHFPQIWFPKEGTGTDLGTYILL